MALKIAIASWMEWRCEEYWKAESCWVKRATRYAKKVKAMLAAGQKRKSS